MDRLLASLCSLRWEACSDEEFARGVADAFACTGRALAVEVGLGEARALFVAAGCDPENVEPSHSPPGVRRRPRAGWGRTPHELRSRALEATACLSMPLGCRHVEAYVVVWFARLGRDVAWVDAAAGVLSLAIDARALVRRVATLSRSAHADNRRLRQDLQETMGRGQGTRSLAMQRCLERAFAVAPYDTPVLVLGESGAGKELIARRIHARSSRSAGPFLKLNCGAVPEALAESELFGHRRGAFTGASANRKGVFERAAGGTLLLDEVGELSLATQVKLLRVLQEGTFTPLGAEDERRTDARVVAATHRDLASLVAGGAFREDLYYRLAVFEVSVPALRQRPEDLPSLVRQILVRVCARMHRPVPVVAPDSMRRLAEHNWPGNVRELQNVLEGALVMSGDGPLTVGALSRDEVPSVTQSSDVLPLEAAIRNAIAAALHRSHGKIYGPGGAAEALELHPATLQSKMRKLGIDRAAYT